VHVHVCASGAHAGCTSQLNFSEVAGQDDTHAASARSQAWSGSMRDVHRIFGTVAVLCVFLPTVTSLAAPPMATVVPALRSLRAPVLRMETPVQGQQEGTRDPTRVAALIAVPLAWGTYGPAVKLAYALPHVPPAPVLQALFQSVSFGGLLLAGVLKKGARDGADADVDKEEEAVSFDMTTLRAGAELGLWLFLGQALQLQGLQRTDAAVAGFLVQLTTILVPLAEAFLLGRQLSPRLWSACIAAAAGLSIISGEALFADSGGAMGSSMLIGDGLVAASALLYTTHVIRLGEYAGSIQPLPLARAKAGAQLCYGFLTILTLSASGAVDGGAFGWAGAISPPEAQTLLLVMLWNGLIPSAFTTWAQTYGQAAVSPSAANVLYSFQPVWNAGIAATILHEQITPSEIAGGAFIILAAILAAGGESSEPEPKVSQS
jgi:drug/metabolite transporter (DMT)-like permease